MLISDIVWGEDSAEKDPNLFQYFINHIALSEFNDRDTSLIVGRKGAGKSAIRKKLCSYYQSEGYIIIDSSPSNNNIWCILSDREITKNFDSEVFFQYVWLRYLLKSALIKVGILRQSTLTSGSLKYARNLAIEAGGANKDIVESVSDILTKVKVKAGKLGDLGLSVEKTLRDVSDVGVLEYHLGELIKKSYKFVFMVDDLDLGWNNSKTANNLLLGLLTTDNYLRKVFPQIVTCIFMREDVYRIILKQTQHSDKFRNKVSIKWTDEDLKNLLNQRIDYNYRKNGIPIKSEPFLRVFPPRVGRNNTLTWLIERTLGRPRELIQFARIYSQNNHTESPNGQVLRKVEEEYSNWKLDDLCTEFMYQYPGLDDVFNFWKKKYHKNTYFFEKHEMEDIILTTLADVHCDKEWFLALRESIDIIGFLKVLYQIGFIGDCYNNKIKYSFTDNQKPYFDSVIIHPCFRKAMEIPDKRIMVL